MLLHYCTNKWFWQNSKPTPVTSSGPKWSSLSFSYFFSRALYFTKYIKTWKEQILSKKLILLPLSLLILRLLLDWPCLLRSRWNNNIRKCAAKHKMCYQINCTIKLIKWLRKKCFNGQLTFFSSIHWNNLYYLIVSFLPFQSFPTVECSSDTLAASVVSSLGTEVESAVSSSEPKAFEPPETPNFVCCVIFFIGSASDVIFVLCKPRCHK